MSSCRRVHFKLCAGLAFAIALLTGPLSIHADPRIDISSTLTVGTIEGPDMPLAWKASKIINTPQILDFRWSTTLSGATFGEWVVRREPVPGQFYLPGALQVATGTLSSAPQAGGFAQFTIDFGKFLSKTPPSQPLKYLVTIAPRKTGRYSPTVPPASPPVTITYQKAGPALKFGAFEVVPTALSVPLPIVLQLKTFECPNADEDSFASDGDEPYLFVVAIFADGTTIDPLNFASSSARLQSPTKTHGNLNLDGVDSGPGAYSIPSATGKFETTILPTGLDLIDFIEDGKRVDTITSAALVAIVVIAMEEDASTTSTANAGRNALVKNLQQEIDAIIHALPVSADIKLNPKKILADLKDKLEAKVKSAMTDETLSNWWNPVGWFAIADPDDKIGTAFKSFSYKQISAAGATGVGFVMDFKPSGVHYRIQGTVKVK